MPLFGEVVSLLINQPGANWFHFVQIKETSAVYIRWIYNSDIDTKIDRRC
jgi:hypothetical protein